MILDAQRVATREKLILAGLYLSKYDLLGLENLGFQNFTEAFNVIAYAMGSRPSSIKNYRDEFDPFFPNGRKGWHRRPRRDYCLTIFEKYKALDLEEFTSLIKSFVGYDENALSVFNEQAEPADESASSFAKRLITGLAAEQYFLSVHANIAAFEGRTVEDTRLWGCGYDFRLKASPIDNFLVVEVKGLRDQIGSISLTPKEYKTAKAFGQRFFLFVVKNFHESPFHEVYQDPLSGRLEFTKSERMMIQVSWLATV
jgi:hypothetical protein